MKRTTTFGARLRAIAMGFIALAGTASAQVVSVNGNIGTQVLQMDANANLFFQSGQVTDLSPGATVDWVKDALANTDTPSLIDSVAIGISPNVSGATGGTGHWWGARIVDGIGTAEQNIFVKGGKENDTSSWIIAPGSVGSAKYDMTQAYIANNQTKVFFGMERRGNNGTTAFDFEFNQLPPTDTNLVIPTRSVGDVLFTFEMQGSGSSGSAVPHIYIWSGTTYVEQGVPPAPPVPPGVVTSINTAIIPASPWGTVDSHGNWILGSIDKFEFAEAQVPLSVLGNLTGCGGYAYVQVRTRSSATSTSDLKDTTRIFRYVFGGPTANSTLTPGCDSFTYDATGSKDASGGTNLTYHWDFVGAGLTGTGLVQDPLDENHYTADFTDGAARTVNVANSLTSFEDIEVTLTVDDNGCTQTAGPNTVTVFTTPSATASLTGVCDALSITFGSTASGGTGSYTYAWKFLNDEDVVVGTSTSASGVFTPSVDGTYHATLTVTDSENPSACNTTVSTDPVTAKAPMNPSIVKGTVSYDGTSLTIIGTAHDADSVDWEVADATTEIYHPITGANTLTITYGGFQTDDTSPSPVHFLLNGVPYDGLQYTVLVRMNTHRTLNGVCVDTSNVLTISQIVATDPAGHRRRHIK